MELLLSQFPLTRPNPSVLHLAPPSSFIRPLLRSSLSRNPSVSIRPPPPGFDYRSEILEDSTSAVAATHPELMDLAADGTLVLVEKRRFGPVPTWRSPFVEPEAIWLIGTSHISEESAADVERVIRALRPDNVVVELCRSRAYFQSWNYVFFQCGGGWPTFKIKYVLLERGKFFWNYQS